MMMPQHDRINEDGSASRQYLNTFNFNHGEHSMLTRLISMLAALSLLLPISSAWADEYTDTINIFKNAGESGKLMSSAYGYAVFPTIGKGGAGIGGAYGKGRVYEKG